jgi:hypothetical protein
MRVDQFEVTNESARLSRPGGDPCFLVVVVPDAPQSITLGGTTFTQTSDVNGVALYAP